MTTRDEVEGAWTRWRPPGQLALFELAHEHVFEVRKGPHVVCPAQTTVRPVNEFIFHFEEEVTKWCWTCSEYVKFVRGVEVPKTR